MTVTVYRRGLRHPVLHPTRPERVPVPLLPSEMPGFELVAERESVWHLAQGRHTVPEQVWRQAQTGASLDVQLGTFPSPEAARIVVLRGRYAVSVHMVGGPLSGDAAAVLEAVARRVLGGIEGAN